jgi:excinuclease ABC subunit C
MDKVQEIIKRLPHAPGVYLYQDKAGKIIYVGKAKDLKKRVSSYFVRTEKDPKTKLLVSKIDNLSTIVTNSEAEALLLEDSLVKQHCPKFNIDLKDDKRYPYFRLDMKDKYPRLSIVRQRKKDGAKYFGPYAGSIGDTLKTINKIFRLRKCQTLNKKGCLYLQLGQCLGPCLAPLEKEYAQEVQNLINFLEGNYAEIISAIEKEIKDLADKEQFEKAAEFRDRWRYLKKISEQQHVVAPDLKRRDIWGVAENSKYAVAQVLMMIKGRIAGTIDFSSAAESADQNVFERTLLRYYQETELPEEVIFAPQFETEGLAQWLAERQVKLLQPKSGFRADLLKLARKNVLKILKDKMLGELRGKKEEGRVKALQEALKLEIAPARIDCFDISNFQGKDTVAAMTVMRNGRPDKNEYRKYHLEQEYPNDFAAMEQVLNRRYYKVLTGEAERPDLIVIDGGKGQLGVAVQVLKKFELSIPVIGLAKKNEEIFLPQRVNPIVLKKNNPALHLIQELRDEAHRFAISFHRHKRDLRIMRSALEDIPGLGPKTRAKLVAYFGSLEGVKSASPEALRKVINIKQAEAVVEYFRGLS